jgi:hypothetical protein
MSFSPEHNFAAAIVVNFAAATGPRLDLEKPY